MKDKADALTNLYLMFIIYPSIYATIDFVGMPCIQAGLLIKYRELQLMRYDILLFKRRLGTLESVVSYSNSHSKERLGTIVCCQLLRICCQLLEILRYKESRTE